MQSGKYVEAIKVVIDAYHTIAQSVASLETIMLTKINSRIR